MLFCPFGTRSVSRAIGNSAKFISSLPGGKIGEADSAGSGSGGGAGAGSDCWNKLASMLRFFMDTPIEQQQNPRPKPRRPDTSGRRRLLLLVLSYKS